MGIRRMPDRREWRAATSSLDPLMPNEPVSLAAGGVALAGNVGNGGKEGVCVCLPHGTSAKICFCPPDPYSSIQTLHPLPCPTIEAVVKLPVSSV